MRHFSFIIGLCFSVSFYSTDINAQKKQATENTDQYIGGLQWRHIGPFRGGRSCAVAGVPGKPNLYYFGATGGGVWKTSDGGRHWKNISDGYFGGSIGSIAIAPSDPNVIYVGGGEKTVRGNVSFGSGAWKSDDAGKSWKSIGLEKSRHIARIRIHPNQPDVVFAAVLGDLFKPSEERGVYKSSDGGKSWKKVLFVNPDAGAVDLCIDPVNHRILYATTWNVRRTPYSLSSGGDGSALWKSTDGGETWTNLSSAEGLPKGVWGISGVAVGYQNNEIVYAIIENENGGVFKSEDGGKTWTKTNDDRSLRQRAWYYTRIYTDTRDDETVYVLNVNYHKSTNGGKSFSSSSAPHGDHHDLWVAPEDPQRMIIGDDGGAQVTYDGGETWSTYHNQPTAQFYRVTTDNAFPYRIYVAQQDNSTLRIAHRTTGSTISESDWEETAGGESAHIAVDPEDNDIVYGGSYDGFLTRVNHKTKSVRGINVWPDNPMGYGAEHMKFRFQWNFPIFFSKHDKNKLYAASNHLHTTTDEGQTWKTISPDLTRNEREKLGPSGGPITKDNTSVEYYATIFAVSESPKKEGLIWAGTDDGKIHLTRDGGINWQDVTSPAMPKYLMVNSVEPSQHDEATCYIAGTCYKSGDYTPYLYKTNDFGKTWTLITSGIKSEHFTRVLREDPDKKGLLYAGTESGMYFSADDGKTWKTLQMNLPIVPITDLAVKQKNLIAATQGRSLWILDDLHLIHQSLESLEATNLNLFKPADAYRMGGMQRKNSLTEGTNHPGGATIHYFLGQFDEKKDTLSICFQDEKGDTIQVYSNFHKEKRNKISPKQGLNQFVWDMTYPPSKSFEGMILWWASMEGPMAVPGNYTVTVKWNSTADKNTFRILQRPDSEGKPEDIKAQFEFIRSINKKIDEAHTAITDIRSLRQQARAYALKVSDKEITAFVEKLDSVMISVEQALYQTKNRSGQDPLNFPIRLTNKLAHLNSLIRMDQQDFPPTASMVEVRDELINQIDAELARWNEIKEKGLKELNLKIKEKSLDVIILK